MAKISLRLKRLEYAGFGRRFLAYFVDALIIFIITAVIQTSMGNNPFLALQNVNSLEEVQQMQKTTSTSLSSMMALLAALAYFMIFYVNYDGATPGKKLMAIKLVRDDGSKVTYPVVFIRYLATFVSAITLGVGYLWMLWDKKNQTIHDKLANTVVIKTKAKPKIAVGLLIMFLYIVFFGSYVAASVYVGYSLGMKELESNATSSGDLQKYIQEMNPEAKVHYDNSSLLFQEMISSEDPKEIKSLNDQNISELKKAIELDPENPEIWNQLGNAYTWISSTGSLEDGLEAFEKAEEFAPDNPIYMRNVGDMLVRVERYDDAVIKLQQTIRLSNDYGYAHLSLANAYSKLGIKDSAKEQYQQTIEIFEGLNDDGRFDEDILRARKSMAAL
ncbi:MAG: hypothetical protein COU65_03565 [Candidatus Pacebacteria bacterium CG10_big_fil_rev_8_21_14_0_10_42_12]|nr:MAG: hypothetical protein COU65_03565 [Candidatus Pacebacteria bacterium CG10_big_fil_rev_8_21_14_0_10_42_12]